MVALKVWTGGSKNPGIIKVLKHYEGYIAKLSIRKMYDEYGSVHYCVDETLRRRLETKLIKTILGFKMVR